jgi:hypothetical protein
MSRAAALLAALVVTETLIDERATPLPGESGSGIEE